MSKERKCEMKYDMELKYTPELIRDLDRVGKNELLKQAKKQLLALREQFSVGGRVKVVSKPHLVKKVKRDIARIKTILAEGGWL